MTAGASGSVATAAERGAVRLPRAYYVAAGMAPLLLLAAWATILLVRAAPPSAASIGAPAPAFALADLDGNPVRLEDLRGRPVIVNFWASWCVPCVDEFPLLKEAATAHQADGLAIVGVVYRDNADAARGFMRRIGAGWPVAMDPGEAVATRYGIIGPPDTFFIDRQGTVVGRQIGQLGAADLQRGLSEILGEE